MAVLKVELWFMDTSILCIGTYNFVQERKEKGKEREVMITIFDKECYESEESKVWGRKKERN